MSQRIEQQAKLQEPKTLSRHYDAFGRNVGYSVDNERKQSIVYDSATGRISESDGFKWSYLLPGTNLKSQLTYPNDAVVTWSYEPHRDLLTAVTNATYSTYVYTNDLLGRRTSKNDEQYGYNVRDELISADNVSYAYDDIGNRMTAEGKTYTANNLNQYTAIDDFTPQYDDDGNQTLIKTETGIWSVVYNAENRPIRWQSGDTVITMSFDRMGRRVERTCPFSAIRLLRERTDLRYALPDASPEGIEATLRGPLGRCVYACDNDAVDHQVVNLLFEGGVTVSHIMESFSWARDRETQIFLTDGEIRGDARTLSIRRFSDRASWLWDAALEGGHPTHESSYVVGNDGLLADWIVTLRTLPPAVYVKRFHASLQSHAMAFAAERSRLSGGASIPIAAL